MREEKGVFFNQDQIVMQHLFKISQICNEAQLIVPNIQGVPQHTNSRCAKDVRMTHEGTLGVRGWRRLGEGLVNCKRFMVVACFSLATKADVTVTGGTRHRRRRTQIAGERGCG